MMMRASKCSEQRLDLVPLGRAPDWELRPQEAARLVGAHGDEVVRSVCVHHVSVRSGCGPGRRSRLLRVGDVCRAERSSRVAKMGWSKHGRGRQRRRQKWRRSSPMPRGRGGERRVFTRINFSGRIEGDRFSSIPPFRENTELISSLSVNSSTPAH